MGVSWTKAVVIGGTGRMGRWFSEILKQAGLEVSSLGKCHMALAEQMIKQSQVVVVSVPMSVTGEVIRKVGPIVPKYGLLMDLTSIKAVPMKVMMENSRCQVVGLHPLFGPKEAGSNKKNRVVVCKGRGEEGCAWIKDILENFGCVTIMLEPDLHDRLMGVVQAVNHFCVIAMGTFIQSVGFDYKDLMKVSTPSFSWVMNRCREISGQSSDLFASLLMENSHGVSAISQYTAVCTGIAQLVEGNNRSQVKRIIESLRSYFAQEDV